MGSDVGSIKEAILEEENGYVFRAGGIEDLFQKMLRASQGWERLSLNSLRLYRDKFSKEKVMESFLQALEGIL